MIICLVEHNVKFLRSLVLLMKLQLFQYKYGECGIILYVIPTASWSFCYLGKYFYFMNGLEGQLIFITFAHASMKLRSTSPSTIMKVMRVLVEIVSLFDMNDVFSTYCECCMQSTIESYGSTVSFNQFEWTFKSMQTDFQGWSQ